MAHSAIINNYLQLVCPLVETAATGISQVSAAQAAVHRLRMEDGWEVKTQKALMH